MAASGSATLSVDECEMSRSCQSGMPSITGTTCARTTLARPLIRSERTGFFLCGMADEPFWPWPKGSASSATSVCCPSLISRATASHTLAIRARTPTHSAIPSRITTWVATSAGHSPSSASTCDSMAGSMLEYVPTGPDSLPTAIPARARTSRSRHRAIANAKSATSVPRCASACSRRPAVSVEHLAISRSVASVSCTASAVSSRSDEVIPKWTYAAACRGTVLSAQADRNAMTSWPVTASIAATASGVGGGAARTGGTLSAGTVPARACASSTRVSTLHQSSYLWASLQTRPISGKVYRSITSSILPQPDAVPAPACRPAAP